MKIEVEATKEEAKAFMLVYSIGQAVICGMFEKAIDRAAAIRQSREVEHAAGVMMRKMCRAIDPDAALVADADETIRLRRS